MERPATRPATAASFDELLVELRAGRYAQRTVLALIDGDSLFLPIEETLELVEIGYEAVDDSVLEGTLHPAGTRLRIHAWEGRASRGDDAFAGRTVLRDWIPYADQELLQQWLDIRVNFDSAELTVWLDPVDHLPIGQRILRERTRTMSFHPGGAREADLRILPEDRLLQGFVLDWNTRLPGFRPDEGSYQLGAGSALSGGALDVVWREDLASKSTAFDGSWHRVWDDRKWFKQLRLGSTQSSSPKPRGIRGVTLGNVPFQRSLEFGQQIIRGALPPYWEVELYRHGELIAFTTTDESGLYEFAVPLDYGQNALELRAYGPHGETRILERADRVDFDRLPDGEFEYGISGGDCPDGDCESAWNLDLRHGFHPRWTLRMGMDYMTRSELDELSHPYAALSGSPWDSWQLRLSSAYRAQHEVRIGYEPSLRWRSELGFTRYDDSVEQPLWQPRLQRSLWEWSALTRPWRGQRSLFLHGNLQRRDGSLGEFWRSEFGIRQTASGVRMSLRWREEWMSDSFWPSRQSELRGGLATVLRSSALGSLSGLFLRGDFTADIGRTDRHEFGLSLARGLGNGARLEVGGRWIESQQDMIWSLAISTTSSFAHWSTYATHSENTRGLYNSGEGSFLYNEDTERFQAEPLRSRGRGGLQGTVFEDRNGNGLRDALEPGVAGARVFVGPNLVETDEYGRYWIWDLLPYQSMSLAVDPQSIRNPLWVPPFDLAETRVIPNGFATVDVALLRAHELSARVFTRGANGVAPLANVRVTLRGQERGRVYEARTFSDGELYISGIAPDRYAILVDSSLLSRAGLRMAEETLYVDLDGSKEPVEETSVTIELLPER